MRASPGAYTLSLLRPEIVRDLDLAAHGLAVSVHEPYLFAPFPDGRKVVTWSSRERTHAQLERDWSRADADGYAVFAERWERAAARARPLMSEPPDRERWLEAVGPGILDGPVAAELRRHPLRAGARALRRAGADRHAGRARGPRHGLRRLLPRPGPGGRGGGRLGLRPRRHGRGVAARCARRPRPPGRGSGWRARSSACWSRTAPPRRGAGRRARRCAPRRVLSNADPLTHGRAGRACERAAGLAPGRAGGQGHGAAGRPARLHGLAGRRAVAGGHRHRLHAGRPDQRRRGRARGPARRAAVDRGRLPDRLRRLAGARRQARAVHVLPVLPGRRGRRGGGRRRRSPASPRCARSCRTGSSAAWRWARASSRSGSASAGGHIFHGEMLPGPAAGAAARTGAASAASRTCTWPGRARTRAVP